jgi:hypothetical protein
VRARFGKKRWFSRDIRKFIFYWKSALVFGGQSARAKVSGKTWFLGQTLLPDLYQGAQRRESGTAAEAGIGERERCLAQW